MKKGIILTRSLLLLLCLTVTNAYAQNQLNQAKNNASGSSTRESTPVETFIRQIKETNKLVPVTNIWQADDVYDQKPLLEKVKAVQPLTIDYAEVANLIRKNTTAISLVVPGINGGTYTIELAQYNCLSNDFQVHSMAGDVETKVDYTPGKYYSGVVKGIPGSVAAFSFFKNEVYGIFSIPGIGNLVLVPNTMAGTSYGYNEHYILYNDKDLKIMDQAPVCSADKLNTDYLNMEPAANKTTTTPNNNVYNNCKEIRVMEVGDYALYLAKGSSVPNATNYLTAIFNNEAILYKNEGVLIQLKYVQINTATDVYQTLPTPATSGPFLKNFGFATQNTYKTTYGCDLAMLATNINTGGGVAYLQALCENYRTFDSGGSYGIGYVQSALGPNFPTYSWNVEVLAHEMGHIVGSPHTHACCWNPAGTGTSAIDGCYTLASPPGAMEPPTCPVPSPAAPPAGGTIMSYCHLASGVGINFSNGFGQQPGDTIRTYIRTRPTSCGAQYNPSIALSTASRTISANRECTDLTSGITYYWHDNNTADQADDTLVLMIVKGTNNIGNLNTVGFSVTANTVVDYGSGIGDTLTFPTGTSSSILTKNYGMRRYWKITPTTAPSTAVEVIFPFLPADTADVHGCVMPVAAPLSDYLMYKANTPVDPNPLNGFPGATASDFSIYTMGSAASTSQWSLTTVGTTQLAHMKMTNLAGGGTGFFPYCAPRPAPALIVTPPPPCPGAVITYSVTPDPLATSYVWTVSGSGWVGTSDTDFITLTAGTGTATITVRAVDSCGNGNAMTFNVTPEPLPVVSISTLSALCTTAATVSLKATASAGGPTSYTWTVLPAGGWAEAAPSSTSLLTVNVGTGTGTIVVNGTNACGVGTDDTFHVTMNVLPPVAPTAITPPPLVCPGGTGIFTTPAVPSATSYTWTVGGTGWSGSSNTTSINVNIGTSVGSFTVTASNDCGTSPGYSRNVSTSTGPAASTSISAPANPCSGSSATLTTPPVATASSYIWSVSGTGWSGSSSTNSINVTVGSGTGTITVTPVNTCGSGGSFTTTIAPAPAPSSTFALTTHIVQTNTNVMAYYTGSAPAGSTFTWSFPGGFGSPGTGSAPQTVYWTTPGQYLVFLTVNNGSGCSSATADTVHVYSPTGIQNVDMQKGDAGIVPNPNNGTFDILFTEPVNSTVSVKLFDMQGRMVYNNDFNSAPGKKVSVTTNNLPPGTYTVTIYANESVISRKITIYK